MVIQRDRDAERVFEDNLFVIASFPRSGSHWTRRMISEVLAVRYGFSSSFGCDLFRETGFHPTPINSEGFVQRPRFVAAHMLNKYRSDRVFFYLRRDFDEVWRSTQKAQNELGDCWWGGTKDECYQKWSEHVAKGCVMAKVVLDYNVVKSAPGSFVRSVFDYIGLPVNDSEVGAALLAGSRENMRKEQAACENLEWEVINKEGY